MTRPVCLIIMDGLAYPGSPGSPEPAFSAIARSSEAATRQSSDEPGAAPRLDAVAQASTPVLDELWAACPHVFLEAAGKAVGLPEGQMGNSEVGHLNMGAGRVIYQELTRIDNAIEDRSFFANKVLRAACAFAREHTGRLHLMGLVSDGGVHSSQQHIYALLELAQQEGVSEVALHCFLDGRDTPPQSAVDYLAQLEAEITRLGTGRIASITGRYYAMDRDRRWDRVQRAYDALTQGIGAQAPTAAQAIAASYEAGINDEFVAPTLIGEHSDQFQLVRDGDAVVFFNFRPDRARELSYAFTKADFNGFERAVWPQTHFVCLCEYDPKVDAAVAFPKEYPEDVLADVIAAAGLRQFHAAETEKYAHVTFFFNGGCESPKPGEERLLIPSPKVTTYDLQPEMSAPEVGDGVVSAIERDAADFYVVNFANGDMVGHTGNLTATIEAVEMVDAQVGRIVEAIRAVGGVTFITADHGNAEDMGAADAPHTAHTCNPVPFIAVGAGERSLRPGKLCDVAATVAAALGIVTPASWTGQNLLA